ncbi:MAG: hypothetical protein P8R54_26955 [Myxococcota bacterium]|nr:hypothetical protein [Myxococcota bacterium]
MKRTLITIVLFFVLALVTACNGGNENAKDGTCANNADCPDNFLCLEEQCIEIGCTESSECALGYYCDATYTCTTGCSEDIDCVAGEACNTQTNTCEDYGCRDTELDCEIGEYCDTTTGECYADSRAHCNSCSHSYTNPSAGCGQGMECLYWDVGEFCNNDNQCDPGFTCSEVAFGTKYCTLDYCFAECNPSDAEACPRGYVCGQYFSDLPTTYCISDCDYMNKNGFTQ